MTNDKKNRRSAKKKTIKRSATKKPAAQKKAVKKAIKKTVTKKKAVKKATSKKIAKKKVAAKKSAPKKKATTKKKDTWKPAHKVARRKVTPPSSASKKAPKKKVTQKASPKKSIARKKVATKYIPATPPTQRKINRKLVHYIVNLPPIVPPVDFARSEPIDVAASSPPLAAQKTSLSSEVRTSAPEPKREEATQIPVKISEDRVAAQDLVHSSLTSDDVAAVDELGKKYQELKAELGKIIIGQESVIEELAICLFARGHGLLMGVPGLAKTLLVSSIAETLHLGFNRIQFTPDLMPADISGTDIIQEHGQTGKREFEFVKGPVFSNIVLADEINRAPAKTQSAMLEAMQERHVTVLGRTYKLDAPFFVLATQNPVEQEGTYPLPEAQLDRFMFLINVEYPSAQEEKRIARETTGVDKEPLNPLLTGEEVLKFQSLVRRVPVPEHIYDYAVEIVRRTRPEGTEAPEWIKEYVGWGAGPRAVQYLILGCKARAALRGTYMASLDDIEAVAGPVLSHRVLTNFAAESQGMTSKKIVARLVEEMRDDV
ncbi:MAG: MoxR family ATPase [Akkermansiaceae bacterium]|jgi:MoxR-like ATPase|nr:MoxR family ATPase [Akkermansiaceae bacterium]